MALKGTLRDFGIADILQLIGQQQKSGVLTLKNKEQEVRVGFKDGSIVTTESTTRKKKDLIGTMLVAAELLTEAQLAYALDEQRRTLRRLGDVLVQTRVLDEPRFKKMVQLQTTETLYRLFFWKSGTYAFEPGEVEVDADAPPPLRAESVLMEGFRMVDEWPVIKKRIGRFDLTFERLKSPPPPGEEDAGTDDLVGFEDAFGEQEPTERKGEFASLGAAERHVLTLATPGRTVRRIVELACQGEFETCKALCNLVNLDYLRVVEPSGAAHERGGSEGLLERVQGLAGRVLAALVLVCTLGFAGAQAGWDSFSVGGASKGAVVDSPTQKMMSRNQLVRIQEAVEVYRLEHGEVPPTLEALVAEGLLFQDDLHYPWRDGYSYRRSSPQEFILLPPLR